MRHLIPLVLIWACAGARADEWTPPENPDPQVILQEARNDAMARRYEIALAKHVWFHEKALSIDPGYYGVRLSFALSYWRQLGQQYPPALTKLKEIRDQAAERVRKGTQVRESFHDLAAINNTLGEGVLTQKTFEALDRDNPKAAKEVFRLAQPALIRGKAYELCGKYVDAEHDLLEIIESYHAMKELEGDGRFRAQHLRFANQKFAADATTLVAILVVNQRQAQAEKIARALRKESDDASFHTALDEALKGVVPEPWP